MSINLTGAYMYKVISENRCGYFELSIREKYDDNLTYIGTVNHPSEAQRIWDDIDRQLAEGIPFANLKRNFVKDPEIAFGGHSLQRKDWCAILGITRQAVSQAAKRHGIPQDEELLARLGKCRDLEKRVEDYFAGVGREQDIATAPISLI